MDNKSKHVRVPKLIHELAKNIADGRGLKISELYNEAYTYWFDCAEPHLRVNFYLFPKPIEIPLPKKGSAEDADYVEEDIISMPPQAFNYTRISPELFEKLKEYAAAFPDVADWRIQTCLLLAYCNAQLFRPKSDDNA